MNLEAASVAYVRRVLQELHLSPTALAKKAGIAATTLTRALNDPDHKFTLSTTTLNKIAEATKISPAPFLDAKDQVQLSSAAVHSALTFEKEGWATGSSPIDRETPFATLTVVIGEISPGEWQDPALMATAYMPLMISLVGVKPKDTFACIVKGTSTYPVAMDGEYLICRRLWSTDPKLYAGRTVIVEVRSKGNFTIELTTRLLQVREDSIELVQFEPDDWRKKKSSVHLKSLRERKDIRILGVVEYVVREPAPLWHLIEHYSK